MSNLSLRSSLLTSLLPLLVAAPSPAQRDGCRDQAGTRSEIVVAPTTEPGERLRIEGFVLDEEGKALPGVEVRVFQTDAAGWYSRGGMDEAKARLCGVFKTADDGSYAVDTVLPGAYATGNGPAPHIHFDMRDPRGFFTLSWTAAKSPDPEAGDRSASVRPLVRLPSGQHVLVYDLVP